MTDDFRPKILFAITKSNFGGAQKYVFDLAKKAKDDFQVSVFSGGTGLLNKKLSEERIENTAMKTLKNNLNPFSLIFEIILFTKIIRLKKPDIIHLNSTKIGLIGVLAGKLLSKNQSKIVFTLHGLALNEPGRSFWFKKIFKLIYQIIFHLTGEIIAVSEKTKKDCLEISPKVKNKISVVLNGLSVVDFFEKNEGKKRLNSLLGEKIKTNDFLIGSVAELHPVKGLSYLIKALPKILIEKPNVKLIILGTGSLKNRLKKEIKKIKLEEKIILAGFVENASKYLPAFDILVISSLSEAMPYVALEGGLSGTPIVATKVGGIPEIFSDRESAILIPPANSEKITEAVLELINNQKLTEKISQTAKIKIAENFNFDKSAIQTFEIYYRLLQY